MKERYFNHELLPNYWHKENIEKYYQLYFHNLKNLGMALEWIPIMDIEYKIKGWKVLDDMYLYNTENNHLALGREIMTNGTYWCICVNYEEGKYILKDGVHRIHALRELIKQGDLKEDFKMLAIVRNKSRKVENPEYIIPFKEVSEVFIDFYKGFFNVLKKDCEVINDFYRTHNEKLGYLSVMMYSLLLRNAMFEHKINTGIIFPPSPIINDYHVFEEWIND